MGILRALGLGLTILVLKSLVPELFSEIEGTALAALHGAKVSFIAASQIAATAGAFANR